MRRFAVVALAMVVLGAVGAELVARFMLGLADPPLYRLDDRIEYLLEPSRVCRPFGNTYAVNSHSMRSAEFPNEKADPAELRILVVGDSIVNGGVRIDQSELATELLRASLAARLRRPVVVGNVSAGSWGPVNQLEYLRRFGTFQADVVVFVLNSDDIEDVPGVEKIGVRWPRHKPALALLELGERAAPGIVGRLTGNAPVQAGPAPGSPEERRAATLNAVRGMVELVRGAGACAVAVQYLDRSELTDGNKSGYAEFRRVLSELGVSTLDTRDAFPVGGIAAGELIQRDGVHPTAAGQRALSGVIEKAVGECDRLKSGSPAP